MAIKKIQVLTLFDEEYLQTLNDFINDEWQGDRSQFIRDAIKEKLGMYGVTVTDKMPKRGKYTRQTN